MSEHQGLVTGLAPIARVAGNGQLVPGAYGLRGRILLLLALTFGGMLGAISYFAYTERNDAIDEMKARVLRNAERIADTQNGVMDAVQQLMALLTETNDFIKFGPTLKCQQLLSGIVKRERRLANILFATPTGKVVCNATPTARPISVADRTYFPKALASTDMVIDEAIVSRSTGKWSLPFARAVRDGRGRMQGVMVAALDLQWVAAEFSKINFGDSARLGLIDDKGVVLARYPDPDKWMGRNASNTTFFGTLIANGGTGHAESPGWDGVQRIYGFSRFANTAAGPIHLWVGVARESALKNTDRRFAWTVSIGLALTALTFGLIWIGSEILILRPVAAISDAARRLGEGVYSARTNLDYADDELGGLARSFDAMAERIASREAQILENHMELQKRAEELRAAQSAALNIMDDAVEARRKAEISEEVLRQRTTELDAANKELEAFSYSVSHDLRAPLRSIDGFSQALLEDYAEKLDDEGKDDLRRVRAATQRMGLLIDDLLKLSRLSRAEMKLETVDLSALAHSVAEEFKAGDPARSVTFDIAPKIEVRGDKRLLEVVLENLIGNAWKFTGKRATSHIEFGAIEKNGERAYFVRDDGAGFDMSHVENLYAPFQRLHSVSDFPGTGIGLATVRRIVQRHGGRVWAEGAIERGATFYFTLQPERVESEPEQRVAKVA